MIPRNEAIHDVLVTGGAGYVGSLLVPRLLEAGYRVRVLDLYLYGEDILDPVRGHSSLREFRCDIRDTDRVREASAGCDAVIHLACISNDPSFDLDPELGRSINYEAFPGLVAACKEGGARRFVYASTSSVYGISDAPEVDEDHPLNPLTDYSRYKAMCEPILIDEASKDFVPVIIRPATLCGYAPRQRLDVIVNILTNHAFHNGRILVDGGSQKRPNLHIEDMVDLYQFILGLPDDMVRGKIYNVGRENHEVSALAVMVKRVVEEEMPDREIEIETRPTNDLRSYHVSSKRILSELGFAPRRGIDDAVRDLVKAFREGKLPNAMEDPRYFNIRMMREVDLR